VTVEEEDVPALGFVAAAKVAGSTGVGLVLLEWRDGDREVRESTPVRITMSAASSTVAGFLTLVSAVTYRLGGLSGGGPDVVRRMNH
jgi:hypothetical protein